MTLVRIAIFKSDPSGVDVPANGYLEWRPSKRRHVEDPDDHVVLPTAFKVWLGADFLDDEGEVVTEGEPGIAWAEVDPTDVPDWAWTVTERTDRGRGKTWVAVPDVAEVEYADLVVLDPDTLDPDEEATAAWYADLNNRVPATGTTGYFLVKGAGATNSWQDAGAGDVTGPASSTDNRVVRMDGTTGKVVQQSPVTISDAGLISGGSMAYADLTGTPSALPPNGAAGGVLSGSYPNPGFAADMATQAELDAEAALARNADNLTSGTVADARIPAAITRDSELAAVATSGSASDITTGTLPSAQLPDLAITDVSVVASQAAMLALTAQKGDVAVRTDNSKTYILSTNSPGTLADWKEITAAGAVTSVNGNTGTVVLAKSDVGLSNVDDVQQQPLDSDLTAIAGLTPANDDIVQRKAGAWTNRTLAQLWTDLKDLTVTLTNKTISLGSNTVSGTLAQFNTAVTDADLASLAGTETLTNKRITRRVSTVADAGGTWTIDSDSYDGAKATALSQATTIAAPTGTPTAMQGLILRIKDNGTARALTWNSVFRAIGVTLPTTTVVNKTLYVGSIWNSDDSKWDAIAVSQEA